MTARRSTLEAAAAQERVIAALTATGDAHPADRLRRCLAVRLARRFGDGWTWTCRGAGCAWCRTTLSRRWWTGLRRWIVQDGSPVSLAVLPLPHRPGALRAALARLRRACRDVRDRAARRRPLWRAVALAGMAAADDTAFVLVSHPGLAPSEVAAVLRKRWPAAAVGEIDAAEPSWNRSTEDAADLARARRGVEPLRIVVLAQRTADAGAHHRTATHDRAKSFEPMPTVF